MTTVYFMRHSEPLYANSIENSDSQQLKNEKGVLSVNGENLAKEVVLAANKKQCTKTVYTTKEDIKTKIEKIAKTIYGAEKVTYFKQAEEKIAYAEKLGKNFYVNIAKTQFSFSDDKKLMGAPTGFEMKIKDIEIRNGANMIVAIAGNIVLMPGLAKKSNYLDIKLTSSGKIDGIF